MTRLLPLIALALPLSASAEVADKVASYPAMWSISVVASVLVAVLSYWKPAFISLALLISGFLGASYLDMVLDEHFRKLIISEMGSIYLISGFLSAGLVLVTSVMAVLIRKRRNGTLRADV